MAIIKISFDISNNKSEQWDNFINVIHFLRDRDNLLIEESEVRMTLFGDSLDIATAIKELSIFDDYPIAFILKV